MTILIIIGTSLLSKGDAYSFKAIAKTVGYVITTLIVMMNVITSLLTHFQKCRNIEKSPFLTFSIFVKLLTTFDPEIFLWLAPTIILLNMATHVYASEEDG